MGGGGGDRYREQVRLDRLREVARQELDRSSRGRNVFVSFAAEDLATINALRAQARSEATDLQFQDWSLKEPFDSESAEYIQRGIRERIAHCSAVIVYLTEHSAASEWVEWEAAEGIRQGKRVFGVYSGDSAPRSVPPSVSQHRLAVIPWTHQGIMEQLDGLDW